VVPEIVVYSGSMSAIAPEPGGRRTPAARKAAATAGGVAVNPSGSVSLIDLSAGAAAATVASYDFLERHVGGGAGDRGVFRLDVGDRARARREAHARRPVFDISGSAPVLTALKPLGFIDRSLPGNELDASDDGPVTR
jgi:hypothetical protein